MGLDLVVEGCPRTGHEEEWRSLIKRSFADEELSETEVARFQQISIPGYEHIGAPQVGRDAVANEWILQARQPKTPDEVAGVLKEFDGYYAVRLLDCDGVPKYSNAGMYEGADDTSFRGAFLNDCQDVLTKRLLNEAWNHKLPEDAVSYGKALLAAADAAETAGGPPENRRPLLSRLGWAKERRTAPIAEQLEIVRAAGRWFIFWGERGHAIRAWF
jgi:hypothetical protein